MNSKELPRKAISVRQPWAWLIVNGFKDVENRSWGTDYRGPILIHAAQKIEHYAYQWVADRLGSSIIIPSPKEIERGGVVGITNIIDVQPSSDSPWCMGDNLNAWIMQDSRVLPFMKCPGKLKLFTVDYNEALLNSDSSGLTACH